MRCNKSEQYFMVTQSAPINALVRGNIVKG